jgi:hypothetical protein
MESTHYDILGIGPWASPEEIRRRFRELALRHHPDVTLDQEAGSREFLRIAAAYHVLRDPERRAEYDQALTREGCQLVGDVADPADGGCAAAVPPVGARVEVEAPGAVMVCRLRDRRGRCLHLTAPPGAPRAVEFQVGTTVRLTAFQAEMRRQVDGLAKEWIRMQPPVLIVESRGGWRESSRRRARRAAHQLSARLVIAARAGGGKSPVTLLGRTRDVSALGVSLVIRGAADLREHDTGRLSLSSEDGIWCESLPARIVRLRNWLRSSGRAVEVGVQLYELPEDQMRCWKRCLARIGVEDAE